ncbi:MAG: hypothetical protein RLZZ74_729 [Cyanobacteriota bacterium]
MNNELNRLETLLPDNLLTQIAIASSAEHRPRLILTKKLAKKRHQIEIDLNAWQEIDLDYRNLLFWYEVARIQQHSVPSDRWQLIVFTAGLGMSTLEITSHHVLLLAVYLLLTVIAGWQLYQNNRGESYLRAATQADQGAILLAQQFGYSLPRAYRSLRGAISMLLKRSPKKFLAAQYQTRRQVLEINAIKDRNQVEQLRKLSLR